MYYVSCCLVNRLWCLIAAVQAFGDAIGEMVIAGVRVAHRVVVGRHACQVNHPDLCLHDNQCVAQAFSCLWSPYSWIMEVPGHRTLAERPTLVFRKHLHMTTGVLKIQDVQSGRIFVCISYVTTTLASASLGQPHSSPSLLNSRHQGFHTSSFSAPFYENM